MEFKNQQQAMLDLRRYADSYRQALLICGPAGAGKTYLAKQYGSMLGVSDFQIIDSRVGTVREAIESSYRLSSDMVLCIENLDCGVDGASYALLKFLEEPKAGTYLIVTCRNIRQIPSTIVSRCVTVDVPGMTNDDLLLYAKHSDPEILSKLQTDKTLWRCVKSPSDIDTLAQLSAEQLQYFASLCGMVDLKTSVSSIVWKFQKFPDNTSTPIRIVIRYLMFSNSNWVQPCINCLNAIATGRLGTHAALSRLAFELKYGWV
ncbi:AAA family ATPase [Ruminococcus sp.]|uniref:AAA family ATPase n=1 Tax=Ruminococcus sp. TaxID=41978 RepID=UPI001B4D0DC3|nr:AAA family ATPase [Ruminococcus sp.]MBP5433761.1 AAA family ATPase [Ruminococcus sp.]